MEAVSRAALEPLSDDGLDMPSAPPPSARKADESRPSFEPLEPLEPLMNEVDPAAAILGLTDDLALPDLDLPRVPSASGDSVSSAVAANRASSTLTPFAPSTLSSLPTDSSLL